MNNILPRVHGYYDYKAYFYFYLPHFADRCQKGGGWELGERVKGLGKQQKERLMNTDTNMVIAEGKGGG